MIPFTGNGIIDGSGSQGALIALEMIVHALRSPSFYQLFLQATTYLIGIYISGLFPVPVESSSYFGSNQAPDSLHTNLSVN
jgi:hypothetical protein